MSALPVWEDGTWEGLAALRGDARADVCVIGLGGSGLSCVHELLRLGAQVIGIDAGHVAAGAAGRNGGFLLAGSYDFYHDAIARHGRERALEIYRLTLEQIERIAVETPAAVRRTGSLRIAASPDERADCSAQLSAMQRDGLPAEWYAGREGEGLLIPSDAAFDPLLRARLLARGAIARGATLYEHTPATRVESGRVVTPHGVIEAETIMVALDGSLARVVPALGDRIRTARLQMLATAPTTEISVPRPVYARFGMEYWQQLPDGRIALGGFRDIGGDAEWTESTDTSPLIQGALERHLRDVLRVAAPITHRWAAGVGYTESGLPVVEEVEPRVWAIGAYSGTGNVIGAICGRAIARLALTGDDSLAAPFSPTRFPRGRAPRRAGPADASTGATGRSRM